METNLPNILTLSRIVAIPVICLLLFVPASWAAWLALGVYAYACVTDFLDGYLARSRQQLSSFGRMLDPIADKLLVVSVMLVLVGVDRLSGPHLFPAVVILCREILVSGLREYLAETQISVPVSRLAKWKTTLQMVAIGFLVVGGAGPAVGPVTTTVVGIIGLWAAAVLTLVTGYDYLRIGLRHMARRDKRPAPVASDANTRAPFEHADPARDVG